MLNSPQNIESNDFTPETEPGKKDGKGWRMKKDGTFEIYHRSPGDSVQIIYKKVPGKEAEVTYCGISRRQLQDEALALGNVHISAAMIAEGSIHNDMDSVTTAIIGAKTLHIPQPGGGVTLGDLEEARVIFGSDNPGFRVKPNTDVNPTVVQLEVLITQQLRMREALLAISKTSGLRALGCLAGQHLTTAEALMRELLRQADTREVDDGK